MYGFEAVTGVGKGAGDYDAHGVVEVGFAHFFVDVNGAYSTDFQSVTSSMLVEGLAFYGRKKGHHEDGWRVVFRELALLSAGLALLGGMFSWV